jgi:hypothetical protein
MVGIAEEPPRQLAPSVESATTGFCHLGGIRRVRHQQMWDLSGQFNRLVSPSFFIRDAASAICISIISDLYAASEEGKQQPRQSRSILGTAIRTTNFVRYSYDPRWMQCYSREATGGKHEFWFGSKSRPSSLLLVGPTCQIIIIFYFCFLYLFCDHSLLYPWYAQIIRVSLFASLRGRENDRFCPRVSLHPGCLQRPDAFSVSMN